MGAIDNTPLPVAQQPLIALLGNPNCGKTALFNRLTGSRQKVANYAGVTIERKEGSFTSPAGSAIRVLDRGTHAILSCHAHRQAPHPRPHGHALRNRRA